MVKNQFIDNASNTPPTEAMQTMHTFEQQLGNLLWVEKALIRTIPKMMEHASTEKLSDILRIHHRHSKDHVVELERVFKSFRKNPETIKCQEMTDLMDEADKNFSEFGKSTPGDKLIVSMAIKFQEYQQGTYQTQIDLSRKMGLEVVCSILSGVLEQEVEILRELRTLETADLHG